MSVGEWVGWWVEILNREVTEGLSGKVLVKKDTFEERYF